MKKFIPHNRTILSLLLSVFAMFVAFGFSKTVKPYQFNQAATLNSVVGTERQDILETPDPTGDNQDSSQGEPGTLPPLDPEPPHDSFDFTSDLIFQAINPGYTIDGTRDVGEFILLSKIADTSLSLAGYSVRYVNSSGTSTTLLNFSESALMTGETLLMRLARSPESNLSDATYMTTLAMTSGRLELLQNDLIIDSVCWGTQADCYSSFKSTNPTTLVRSLETGDFAHEADYLPPFDPSAPSLFMPAPSIPDDPNDSNSDETPPSSICRGLEFSEIFTYYSDSSAEQFIELYNSTDTTIDLTACSLRYKNKTYALTGQVSPDSYYAYYPSQSEPQFTLTKNPTSSNSIELLDYHGDPVDILTYSHGQKKAMSYARFYDSDGDDLWQQTYNLTPSTANIYQEFRTCPAGKVINPSTGNCIKASTLSTTITECPEGKYRNPLTGRCKNIESASTEPKPCADGYERNPETNRCRKIQGTNDGAGYALVPNTYTSSTSFIAAGLVALVVSGGSLYIILQFRREIARTARKVRQGLHRIAKDLLSRRISFHRHKKP